MPVPKKILLCCEHFSPSVGGVQKTMHELGLRFIQMGHQVSVATSWHENRSANLIDGMQIHSFKIHGNSVSGMKGPIAEYQNFLIQGDFDVLLVMAAQQWTLDALLTIIEQIPYKKIHLPCGYSSFYLPSYKEYFQKMAQFLKGFDKLIYNATDYRDINFAKLQNAKNINIIPAGASEIEFTENPHLQVLKDLDISSEDFVFLSVGAPAFAKGHGDVIRAYLKANILYPSCLILNGNYDNTVQLTFQKLATHPKKFLKELALQILGRSSSSIRSLGNQNNDPQKKIIFTSLPRPKVISLFFESDLFLFASHIEYSPLVIFECLAAGLPFLATPVGNSAEIIDWSGGGLLVPATKSPQGRTQAKLDEFSQMISKVSKDSELLLQLSTQGRESWKINFTWKIIAENIAKLF